MNTTSNSTFSGTKDVITLVGPNATTSSPSTVIAASPSYIPSVSSVPSTSSGKSVPLLAPSLAPSSAPSPPLDHPFAANGTSSSLPDAWLNLAPEVDNNLHINGTVDTSHTAEMQPSVSPTVSAVPTVYEGPSLAHEIDTNLHTNATVNTSQTAEILPSANPTVSAVPTVELNTNVTVNISLIAEMPPSVNPTVSAVPTVFVPNADFFSSSMPSTSSAPSTSAVPKISDLDTATKIAAAPHLDPPIESPTKWGVVHRPPVPPLNETWLPPGIESHPGGPGKHIGKHSRPGLPSDPKSSKHEARHHEHTSSHVAGGGVSPNRSGMEGETSSGSILAGGAAAALVAIFALFAALRRLRSRSVQNFAVRELAGVSNDLTLDMEESSTWAAGRRQDGAGRWARSAGIYAPHTGTSDSMEGTRVRSAANVFGTYAEMT